MTMGQRLSKTYKLVEDQALAIQRSREQFSRLKSEHIISVGKLLMEAQSKLSKYGDGVFIKWLKERLHISKTTAYKWIQVADIFGDCPQCVQRIQPSALYKLAQAGLPAGARRKALEAAEKGGTVTLTLANQLIANARGGKSAREKGKKRSDEHMAAMKMTWNCLVRSWKEASDEERREFNNWRDNVAEWPGGEGVRWRLAGMSREEAGIGPPKRIVEWDFAQDEHSTHLYRASRRSAREVDGDSEQRDRLPALSR